MSSNLGLDQFQNKETLVQRVYNELRKALLTGKFQPGQRITVRDVAEALGVSITPAREAIGRITAEGGLETTGPKTLVVPFLSQERFQELEDIRVALETIVAKAATKNVNQLFINRLEAINSEFVSSRAQGRFQQALEKNFEFHSEIYKQSGKVTTASILENIWLASGPVISLLYPAFSSRKSGIIHHQRAIEGFRVGDPKQVCKALTVDIRTGYRKLRSRMKELAA